MLIANSVWPYLLSPHWYYVCKLHQFMWWNPSSMSEPQCSVQGLTTKCIPSVYYIKKIKLRLPEFLTMADGERKCWLKIWPPTFCRRLKETKPRAETPSMRGMWHSYTKARVCRNCRLCWKNSITNTRVMRLLIVLTVVQIVNSNYSLSQLMWHRYINVL